MHILLTTSRLSIEESPNTRRKYDCLRMENMLTVVHQKVRYIIVEYSKKKEEINPDLKKNMFFTKFAVIFALCSVLKIGL